MMDPPADLLKFQVTFTVIMDISKSIMALIAGDLMNMFLILSTQDDCDQSCSHSFGDLLEKRCLNKEEMFCSIT